MNLIEYKAPGEKGFKRYIDIGSLDWTTYIYFAVFEEGSTEFSSFSDWVKYFDKLRLGEKLMVLRFYVHEYLNWDIVEDPRIRQPDVQCFGEQFGKEITSFLAQSIDRLEPLISRWFLHGVPIFKGIDWDCNASLEELFERVEEDEDGVIFEVEDFEGGVARIIPVESIDTSEINSSFYVPEEDFKELDAEVALLCQGLNGIAT